MSQWSQRILGHGHCWACLLNTVDTNLKISSVIGIETTKKDLVGFSPSVVLADGQAWHLAHGHRWVVFKGEAPDPLTSGLLVAADVVLAHV